MTLLIADDNPGFRQRLSSLLGTVEGIDRIGEAGDVPGAIEAIERMAPQVIILDVVMPGGSGLDVLRFAKNLRPAPKVIMLTLAPKHEYRSRCMAAGADYFFQKADGVRRMISVLKEETRKWAIDS